MITKTLKRTNFMNLAANDSYLCKSPSRQLIIVNYDDSVGNLWISTEGEAVVGGEFSMKLPPKSSLSFSVNSVGNKIYLLAEGACNVSIATPQ